MITPPTARRTNESKDQQQQEPAAEEIVSAAAPPEPPVLAQVATMLRGRRPPDVVDIVRIPFWRARQSFWGLPFGDPFPCGVALPSEALGHILSFVGGRTLKLIRKRIRDVAPLQHLTRLQTLDLSQNRIADVTPLRQLTQLHALRLGWYEAVCVAPSVLAPVMAAASSVPRSSAV